MDEYFLLRLACLHQDTGHPSHQERVTFGLDLVYGCHGANTPPRQGNGSPWGKGDNLSGHFMYLLGLVTQICFICVHNIVYLRKCQEVFTQICKAISQDFQPMLYDVTNHIPKIYANMMRMTDTPINPLFLIVN